MFVIVSYDVSTVTAEGRTRLRKVAKTCQNYGVRAQNSVFECNVDPGQWVALKSALEAICDAKQDSLRYYFLGDHYQRKIEHFGIKAPVDVEGPLLL